MLTITNSFTGFDRLKEETPVHMNYVGDSEKVLPQIIIHTESGNVYAVSLNTAEDRAEVVAYLKGLNLIYDGFLTAFIDLKCIKGTVSVVSDLFAIKNALNIIGASYRPSDVKDGIWNGGIAASDYEEAIRKFKAGEPEPLIECAKFGIAYIQRKQAEKAQKAARMIKKGA